MKSVIRKSCTSLFTGWLLFGLSGHALASLSIIDTPLIATQVTKPLTMLVSGKDHKLFFEAYNDASDVDGDGTIDLRFKPSITYYGLFDSNLCYTHNDYATNAGLFSPSSVTASGKCPGKWAGNFLNYLTTSRIDALRKVLYGGYREVDNAAQTILRRAYIPQDGHSWGKEYTSETVDGFKISDYTPLNQPTANKRHLFGNMTANITAAQSCSTLNLCSNLPPLLVTVTNATSRVWEWASSENPVLTGNAGGTRTDRAVRVEVCTASFHDACKQYPNLSYKPTGLLHDYGENDAMLFGLLTGSYDKNMSGGVLRKVVSSFTDEVDKNTGLFTASNTIVKTFNNLRIRDHNYSSTGGAYRNGSRRTRIMNQGEFVDWGNPMGEMMYETLRYFAGKAKASAAYTTLGSNTFDTAVGISEVANWDNPYDTVNSKAKAPWCAKPNMLVISDIAVSYDSDQLPGSSFAAYAGDLGGLDVSTFAKTITDKEDEYSVTLNLPELKITGSHFIGQSTLTNFDSAPTAKTVTNLATVRGLSPDEPNKQGSYYSGSVAYFGKTNDLNDATGDQKTDTYVVALASPLPKFEVTIDGKKISLVPFAKTVDGAGSDSAGVDRTKGKYQPTDGLVDFYLDTIANTNSSNIDAAINSGRPFIKFRINFEADEQGNDYDMDVIGEYVIQAESNGSLTVTVQVIYESTGSNQNIGYVISGTNRDGVYLVAQDKNEDTPYFLNVPPNRNPGYCAAAIMPNDCKKLPYYKAIAPNTALSTQTFTAGATVAASTMKDPLWYAAKWGGFSDRNANALPDLSVDWDKDGDGTPDTYNLVQNPLKLKDSLKRSFDSILERSASAGNITSNGQEVNGGDRIFQSSFNSATWDGELTAKLANDLTIEVWKASLKMPTETSRKIFTRNDTTTLGVAFDWDNLSASEQGFLGTKDVLNYLRGNQSQEIQYSSSKLAGSFRNRSKRLGDIAHSSPYYAKEVNAVFVGANDGMLHAFDADTGIETFAYIPSVIYDKLKDLSSPFYSHKFYVDGDIAVSSKTLTPGKNLLVASLGRGAKALFGLNVTNPSSFANVNVLWELSNTTYLGYVLGRPQIAKLNNDVVAAVVGNGYNSTDGSAVLLIINLETGSIIKSIDTWAIGDNGLATPTLVDTDSDGKADYVYAGDLKGNVWKFDLSDTDKDKWKLASPTPLFIAKNADNTLQPITAQILVTNNNLKDDPNIGKTFLLFGTGSYNFSDDPANKSVQTWYGIIDDGSAISSRTQLTSRSITTVSNVSGKPVRVFANAIKSPNDMIGKKGWYLDLIDGTPPTPQGERIVTSSQLISSIEPVLVVSSIIPVTDDICKPEGRGYINAINAFTGGSLTDYFFDVTGNGSFDTSDMVGSNYVGSIDIGVGMPSQGVLVGDKFIVGGSTGEIGSIGINFGIKKTGRFSWREIRLQ